MASWKRISFQHRLFLPILGMLWLIIIGFSFIQYEREKNYKSQYLKARIDLINQRILYFYEHQMDPTDYMSFIDEYFDSSVLDNLSITLYDAQTGEIVNRIGFPAPMPDMLKYSEGRLDGGWISANNNDDSIEIDGNRMFYYNVAKTSDGSGIVQTLLPYDAAITEEIKDTPWWWFFVIVSCGIVTIVTYFTTRQLTRNIKQLKNFAAKAAKNYDAISDVEFSGGELGEISKQIVSIYNARRAALASRELEHKVALKATEDRNQMRKQLTNNINHELKTPAAIIKGYVDTILDTPDMDEDSRKHFMLKIQAQIERLCSILNDLSTMTRLDEAATRVSLEAIDFHQFVSDLAIDIEESGVIGDMTFKYDVPEGCIVKGNHTLLTGALMNLAKNSAAYSQGTEMGIRFLSRNRKFYTFVFYDNGTGVPEEHIPMLFERFYRVDKGRSRKSGGTGLGLSIVRSSFNTIGGSVSVRNGNPRGLEFVFTLRVWDKQGSPEA